MDPTKRCPMCGELILRIAVRCKHCQADLHALDASSAASFAAPPATHDGVAGSSYPSHPFVQGPGYPPPHLGYAPPPHPGYAPPPHPGYGATHPHALADAARDAQLSLPAMNGPATHGASPPASAPRPPVNVLGGYVAPTEGTFEHRFLDYAFKTSLPINAATLAYALKIGIDEADEGLQDLVVRDVLLREVDGRGAVTYLLPGRSAVAAIASPPVTSLAPYYAQPPQLLYDPPGSLMTMPTENTALAGLLVNCCFPGLGSLIGGKTSLGVFQLLMFLIGIPLSIFIIGLPMLVGSWIWAVVTGVNMLNEAKQQTHRRMLAGG